MSRLSDAVAAGRFAVTAELAPPASAAAADLDVRAAKLEGHVDAVNVTDGAGARAHMSSLAAAALLLRRGIEPVLQMTCRDRNRIALQSDLLGAGALGIENVLILRGDDPSAGDQPDAKAVFDLDSRELMETARRIRDDGLLPSGRKIASPPSLFIGAADTPADPGSGAWKPDGLLAKIDAGARFVQTQFCFDVALARRYAAALVEHGIAGRCAVLMGIGPIPSAASARWMRDNLWGTTIPDAVVERLETAADPKAEGTAICAELIAAYVGIEGLAGVHLMAPAGVDAIPAAIEESGIRTP